MATRSSSGKNAPKPVVKRTPIRKAEPKMLGTGSARKAAESLKGRSRQIEDALRDAGAAKRKKDNGRRNA